MKNVLITGASGLIGSELAKLLSNNYNLICLVRDAKKIDHSIDAKFIVADVRYSLLDHFKGLEIDTIYHLASLNPLYKDKRMQMEVNINGMKNIIEVAKATNAKHFIYAQGMGIFENREEIDEDTPINPDTEFAKRRLEAQQLLYANKDRFNICIPILGDVYGHKGWFMELVRRLKSNRLRIPGSGEYYRSFIHIYDAANALKMLGEQGKVGYYMVCDDQPVKFIDFVYYTADILRVKRPGKITPFIARLVLSSDMLKLLMRSTRASNSKLKKDLNFRLRFPDYKSGIGDVLTRSHLSPI